jgi:hypothetical protein
MVQCGPKFGQLNHKARAYQKEFHVTMLVLTCAYPGTRGTVYRNQGENYDHSQGPAGGGVRVPARVRPYAHTRVDKEFSTQAWYQVPGIPRWSKM